MSTAKKDALPPAYAKRLEKLIVDLDLNQTEISRLAALDQSSISHYLAGRREPSKFSALIFAGLSKTLGDRAFWLEYAGIDEKQRSLLSAAVGLEIAPRSPEDYEDQIAIAFLRFWSSPQNDVREKVKDLLQTMIFRDFPPRK